MVEQRVTVIIPAFNASRTLGAALASALNQTRRPDQVIVIDDASTDGTADLAAAFPDVTVISRAHNGGCGAARNTALAQADGDLIAWLDADDQWLPAYLQRMLEVLAAAGPRTIVTSDAWVVTPNGITGRRLVSMPHPKPADQRLAMMRSNFATSLTVYPRSLHDEIGLLDPALRGGEDRDLWLRALLQGWTLLRQSEPLALYSWSGRSMSAHQQRMDAGEDRLLERAASQESWVLTDRESDFLRLRAALGSPRRLLAEADEALRRADYRTARRRLATVASLLPGHRRLRLRAMLGRIPLGGRLARQVLLRSDKRIGWTPAMRK